MMEEEKRNLSNEELEKVSGGTDNLLAWQCTVCTTMYQGAEPPTSCMICGNDDRKKFICKAIIG